MDLLRNSAKFTFGFSITVLTSIGEFCSIRRLYMPNCSNKERNRDSPLFSFITNKSNYSAGSIPLYTVD